MCSAFEPLEMLVVRWNRWFCPGLCLWHVEDVGCEVEPLVVSWALPVERWRCWFCPRFCLWNVGDVGCEVEPLVVSWTLPMECWRCWFCPRFCLWNVGDVGSVLCSAYGTLEILVVR